MRPHSEGRRNDGEHRLRHDVDPYIVATGPVWYVEAERFRAFSAEEPSQLSVLGAVRRLQAFAGPFDHMRIVSSQLWRFKFIDILQEEAK